MYALYDMHMRIVAAHEQTREVILLWYLASVNGEDANVAISSTVTGLLFSLQQPRYSCLLHVVEGDDLDDDIGTVSVSQRDGSVYHQFSLASVGVALV